MQKKFVCCWLARIAVAAPIVRKGLTHEGFLFRSQEKDHMRLSHDWGVEKNESFEQWKTYKKIFLMIALKTNIALVSSHRSVKMAINWETNKALLLLRHFVKIETIKKVLAMKTRKWKRWVKEVVKWKNTKHFKPKCIKSILENSETTCWKQVLHGTVGQPCVKTSERSSTGEEARYGQRLSPNRRKNWKETSKR